MEYVEQLLHEYMHTHAFKEGANKNDHAKACALWIQEKAREQGILVHFWQITSKNNTFDTLLSDGCVMFSGVCYSAIERYLLQCMEDYDLFHEEDIDAFPRTCAQYRSEVNAIEKGIASLFQGYEPAYGDFERDPLAC